MNVEPIRVEDPQADAWFAAPIALVPDLRLDPPEQGLVPEAEQRELMERIVGMPEPRPEPPSSDPEASWPEPPGEAAYHGILGEIVAAVAPTTEADPVGILGTLLVMFGAACGGHRSFYQGSRQRTDLFVLLAGATGFGGRKGTILDVSRGAMNRAYPDLDGLWLVGVASGEAIAGHLIREAAKAETARRPAEDRVLIVEPEFGRLLTVMSREGNTVSPILRNAWDGVPLGHARARDESLVTVHHVSLIGHVTPTELRAKLTAVDSANGFANRLLILAVRRARIVPFPQPPDALVTPYIVPLRRAIDEAHDPGELEFDERARERWESFYVSLAATPRLGLSGAVTGRHEAQVARLALVYALADRSPAIGEAHLEAAIEVAEYARRSAVHVLGDSTGNRHADALRDLLSRGEIAWRDARTELGLRTAADLSEAVAVLVDAGIAQVVEVPRAGGGRPRRVIRANDAKDAKGLGAARTQEHGNPT